MKCVLIVFCFILVGCESSTATNDQSEMQEICGRNDHSNLERLPVYRAKVPRTWQRKDPEPSVSIEDTKTALCEFTIPDEKQQIKIVIHNFPLMEGKSIPPMAQIARWRNQFSVIDQTATKIIPQAYSGFVGYLLEASEQENPSAVMAWALQIAPEHHATLNYHWKIAEASHDKRMLHQMMADLTIKATGSKQLLKKFRRDIINFARSIELIQEIPESP